MFTPSSRLRALLSLTTALSLAAPAFAQTSTATPPARVGQVADVSGNVSFNGAGSNGQWVAATPNYPVTTGDSLFTQSNSQAALAIGSSQISLAPNTEVQLTELDDTRVAATQSQGETYLRITDLQPGQDYTIATPRGVVTITQDGAYDITAGDAGTPTTLAVLYGAAAIGQLQVPAGQEGYLSGTSSQTTAQLGPLQQDSFMQSITAQMAPPPPPYAPPVVQQMTGVGELSNYGDWSQSPQYGAVWYPNVAPGWAPYREGHWAYVAPWGWTWVDAEPWGFAPFHYGRWVQYGGRWGWVPAAYSPGGYGPVYQPVYAPAVVNFVGLGAGVAITASLLSQGSIGWVPLAPDEPYYPCYHTDHDYLRRINRVDVRNYQQININNYHTLVVNHYVDRSGATFIPAQDMARGAPVANYGRPIPGRIFAQAHPMPGDFNRALRPNFSPPPAPAPRPGNFAQHRAPPPMVISHQPVPPQFHPQAPMPQVHSPTQQFHPPMQQQFHPPMQQQFHPPVQQQFHPPVQQQFHPPMQQQFQPPAAPRPPAPPHLPGNGKP